MPETLWIQPACGASARTLFHFPLQPPVVSEVSAATYCWEAFLRRRVVLTRHLGGLPHRLLCQYCCCCFCVFLFVVLGLFVVPFFSCLPLFCCLGLCDSIHLWNHLQWSVPRVNGPASSEVLPPRIFVLSFNFGLPRSFCCVFSFLL